jgi:hypothetical protein
MKFSLASVNPTLLAELSLARNCNAGLDYCGSTLNKIGRHFRPKPLLPSPDRAKR